MAGKETEQAEVQKLLGKLEEEISLSYYLKPGTITVGRDLVQALQDLLANPENWEEN
ncbi:hypothetical protein lacNasYZ03_14900 [Lactobacillus nasalidis]|uniref:Uncharacterized protein n=1 Tax=Lactobacillus nasalidis TaxID=2797258 RepID=A0ABQ3W5I4_9LACO|nr:hypothetical protein [Lactobacillus nasalidis]GHV97482.1 hypothetical protein lacNasYZ01_06640 [Lactobacillus nasalidis]GHV99375.1 hypothetical protein lacNasYZ02_08050 [Lactobacillus nasalidis]GHW01803.1 hypothetical protein lacNasYZ03_14900 [Lactobacillus nasalidis]